MPMHHIRDKAPDEAWAALQQAGEDRDVSDFKEVGQFQPR